MTQDAVIGNTQSLDIFNYWIKIQKCKWANMYVFVYLFKLSFKISESIANDCINFCFREDFSTFHIKLLQLLCLFELNKDIRESNLDIFLLTKQ